MKKVFLPFIIILISLHFSIAQDHLLELNPACPGVQSPFTKVLVLDKLANKELLGFVKGSFDKREQIRYEGSLADTLGKYFILNSSPAIKPRTIVLIINELFLSEMKGDFGESGSLKLALRLFAEKENGNFSELFSIDSVYTVRGMDVTKKLLRSVNEQLCQISNRAATLQPSHYENNTEFELSDLYTLENLEKLSIPLYTTNHTAKGIYNTFKDLKINTPNDTCEIFVDTTNINKIKVYKVYKVKNRKFRLETEGIYAISNGDKLYKATAYGFYEVKKESNDFFYFRPATISESNLGANIGATFGLVGALLASGLQDNKAKFYKFKINYRRGNSTPITILQ